MMIENSGNGQTKNKVVIKPGPERVTISSIFCGIAGLVIYVGMHGLGFPLFLSLSLLLPLFPAGAIFLAFKLPLSLDGVIKKKPWLSSAWLIAALAAILQTGRLSVFMIDSTQTNYSLFPNDKWMIEHCCLTAYNEGARLQTEGTENIYDIENYRDRKLAGFNVDLYHYPPPFLLLPITIRSITGDEFLNVRSLWFSITVIMLLIAFALTAYRVEPRTRLRFIGMAPLIWCSMPLLSGLQMSNVQVMLISTAVIAWALLPRSAAAGGLLIAMSAAAKIFPGILFLYLILRKKWKEAAWTAAFIIVLTLLAMVVVGINPFRMFFEYEMPRLSSGEAFSRPFSRVFAVSRNMAPFGIPLKFAWPDTAGIPMEIGRIVSMIYLLGVLFLTYKAASRRYNSRTEEISVWLSLLCLGSLVSPFAPANYVLFSLVWLVCINRDMFRPVYAVIIWLIISLPFLVSREASFLIQTLTHVPAQVLAVVLPAVVLWHSGLRYSNKTQEEKNLRYVPREAGL